jgi:protoporphyrinogen/coproporphyrinogen III oxidase
MDARDEGERMTEVVVVGAGVAGLTAAYRLRRDGFGVTVLEASDHVGGRMRTEARDGYRMDTGAYLLSTKYERMRALIDELGLGSAVEPGSDVLGILRDGRVHRVGASVLAGARSRALSWRAKLAAARMVLDARRLGSRLDWFELSRASAADDESAADYALRRGGRELLDHVVDPVMRVCFMDSSDRISKVDLLFAVNNFFGAGLFNLRDGIGSLPDELARRVDVRLGTRVTEVRERPDGVTVARDGAPDIEADACVLTLGAREMATVHPGLPGELRAAVARLRYVRYLVVKLALRRPPAEPALALLVPAVEDAEVCAIELDHNKLPACCPPGTGMASLYWHVDRSEALWDRPDDEVVDRAVTACGPYLPGLADDLAFGHVVRWDPGWVLPAPGGYADMRLLARSRETSRRVHLAGDYFGGSTTNSALCSGERAAEHVRRALGGAPGR